MGVGLAVKWLATRPSHDHRQRRRPTRPQSFFLLASLYCVFAASQPGSFAAETQRSCLKGYRNGAAAEATLESKSIP